MKSQEALKDPRQWIEGVIRDFIATSPLNTMRNKAGEKSWDDALVGFASGSDPIWQQYKEYVGPFHWTPWEIYSQQFPRDPAAPQELTVISWILPQREPVRETQSAEREVPLRGMGQNQGLW